MEGSTCYNGRLKYRQFRLRSNAYMDDVLAPSPSKVLSSKISPVDPTTSKPQTATLGALWEGGFRIYLGSEG
eukprot:4964516-Amphidinium_carterae.1